MNLNTKKCRGRPASFNREELITEVMELFWEHGYNNLSLNEIAKETGLTRASLYNAFHSKEALFLEAVDHYFSDSPDSILTKVKKGEPVGPAFFQLFNQISHSSAVDEKRRGCLAVNCLSELSTSNSELGNALADLFEAKNSQIKSLIQQAVDQHELPVNTDPETTSNIIQAFMSGFSVLSKNGMPENKLQAMCHTFLKNIGFAAP